MVEALSMKTAEKVSEQDYNVAHISEDSKAPLVSPTTTLEGADSTGGDTENNCESPKDRTYCDDRGIVIYAPISSVFYECVCGRCMSLVFNIVLPCNTYYLFFPL